MAYFLDGKVSAVFGTHTHVQTADEVILPKGTGNITDLGMTGPQISILGRENNAIIKKFITGMPQKFEIVNEKDNFAVVFLTLTNKAVCVRTLKEFLFVKISQVKAHHFS